jgi:hypothetical protein
MSKLFEQTIAKVKQLPADDQDAAAFVLIDYLEHRRDYQLADEQLEEVRRRIADPNPTFVSYEEARRRLGLQD